MQLAKPVFDVALNTASADVHRAFWSEDVGLSFEERLTLGEHAYQYRYGLNGAVVKICAYASVPECPPSGYRELLIPRNGIIHPVLIDVPGGGRVTLVEPGHAGITRLGMRMAVRSLAAHRRFFADALGVEIDGSGIGRIGQGVLLLEESAGAPTNAGLVGHGWRCLTIQIFDVDSVHAAAVQGGAGVGSPPARFGDIAKYSMITDPDGNWIELSQRASLTGSLD